MEIVSKKAEYELLENSGILVNSEIREEYLKMENSLPEVNEKDIVSTLRISPDDNTVAGSLANVKSMVLSLVEECNFRCDYCVFSGSCENERVHKEKSMSYETAIKAIDFFLNFIDNPQRCRKDNQVYIGFYGGEPLLKFDLIKKLIERAERVIDEKKLLQKFQIDYRMTTNGYLLTEDVADYLKEKSISVDISLDGPEHEHDKFRKGKDGEKTFKKVMSNIESLYNRHPAYYEEKVHFLATLHPLHDLQRIEDFFNDPKLFGAERVRATTVNMTNLRPSEKEKVDRMLKDAPKQNPNSFLFSTMLKETIYGKFKLKNRGRQTSFTGTCFPGAETIMVDSDGNFHMCDRVPGCFPIGNVDTGYDFEKIRRLLRIYNEEIISCKCWECDVWFLCDICFAHAVAPNNKLKIRCKDKKKEYKKIIDMYLESREENDEINANSDLDGTADYIDQL
ncbi:MAG: radical SAM protein [bacterium]|nr:radical SAM protein [bacterium]